MGLHRVEISQKVFIFSFLLTILGCTTPSKEDIDLRAIGDWTRTTDLDSLCTEITFIPLETSDSCLITSASILGIDEENILIADRWGFFRFDTKGHFLNQIGKRGKGHGEYQNVTAMYYDTKRKIVSIGTGSGEINKYRLDGTFVEKIKIELPKGFMQSSTWSDFLDAYICESREYQEDGLDVWLHKVSGKGKTLETYHVYHDDLHVERNMMGTGRLRTFEHGVMFILPFDDRVFIIGKDGVQESFRLYRGDKSPNRKVCEEMKQNDALEKRFSIENWLVTPSHFYLWIYSGNYNYNDVVVDRKTKTIIHNHKYTGNDETKHFTIKGFDFFTFWPWNRTENRICDLVPIETFKGKDLEKLKEAAVNDFIINEQSNPVVVVAKIKAPPQNSVVQLQKK